jgi:hypothetical protein
VRAQWSGAHSAPRDCPGSLEQFVRSRTHRELLCACGLAVASEGNIVSGQARHGIHRGHRKVIFARLICNLPQLEPGWRAPRPNSRRCCDEQELGASRAGLKVGSEANCRTRPGRREPKAPVSKAACVECCVESIEEACRSRHFDFRFGLLTMFRRQGRRTNPDGLSQSVELHEAASLTGIHAITGRPLRRNLFHWCDRPLPGREPPDGLPIPDTQHENRRGVGKGRFVTPVRRW